MALVETEVAIVGAGAAGCVAAAALGAAGRRVLLLERAHAPVLNGADFLKPTGIRVLERLGLLGEVARRGALRRNVIHYYHDGELIIDYDYAHFTDVGYYLIVPYATLMEVLLARVRDLPSVTLWVDAGVESIRTAEGRVEEIVVQGGRLVRPEVLVGADGAHSVVRAAMQIEEERGDYDQDVYMATFPIVPSVAQRNRMYISSRRWMVYLYPATADLMRVCVSLPVGRGEEVFSGREGGLSAHVRDFVTESDDALSAVGDLSGFCKMPTAYLHASRYHAGTMAIVGDAAHNGHPVTGQGLNLSFEDAETLAEELTPALADGGDVELCLAACTRRRRPVNRRVLEYGNELLRVFHDRAEYLRVFDPSLHGAAYRAPPADAVAARPGA